LISPDAIRAQTDAILAASKASYKPPARETLRLQLHEGGFDPIPTNGKTEDYSCEGPDSDYESGADEQSKANGHDAGADNEQRKAARRLIKTSKEFVESLMPPDYQIKACCNAGSSTL